MGGDRGNNLLSWVALGQQTAGGMSLALDVFLFASGWTHVLLAPYTKVEESFNLHATHDVLMYGITTKERQYVRDCSWAIP